MARESNSRAFKNLSTLSIAVQNSPFDLPDHIGNWNITWASLGAVIRGATTPHARILI